MAAGRRRRLLSPPAAAEEEEVDHISHLPDDIIHHIFSFLPFKDVVKTSALSKQWRFAWTTTPYIHLSLPSEGVVPSISRALRRCRATELEKFHLDEQSTELDRWIHFAVARKVKDASLAFGSYNRLVPRFLYGCASLVSLRVSHGHFSRGFAINWPSLKKLCLRHFLLDSDGIPKILSGCPVLESLRLCSSRGPGNLRIDSRSLRELTIESVHVRSLDVSAPNLVSLRWSGTFSLRGLRLNVASSLAEAELNFDEPTNFHGWFPDRLKFLLERLQHVAKITIGSWCLEVLSAAKAKGMSRLSSRWRNIIVYAAVSNRGLLGMAYLLRSSPLLERLVICKSKSDEFTFKNMNFPELCYFDAKKFWLSQKEFFCVANHLKRVEIVGFQFYYEKPKLLLALAEFLLEKAVGLEKMIINAELRMSHRGLPTDPHDLRDFDDAIKLQKGCRRASRNAEVIVNYRFDGLPYELWKRKLATGHFIL